MEEKTKTIHISPCRDNHYECFHIHILDFFSKSLFYIREKERIILFRGRKRTSAATGTWRQPTLVKSKGHTYNQVNLVQIQP